LGRYGRPSSPDGAAAPIAVFDALHRRGTVTEAMLFAFDLLDLDGSTIGRFTPVSGLDRHPPVVGVGS
jgi:hypothetical protein